MSVAIEAPPQVSLRQAFMVWLRIGLTNFGGPAGQIATMHKLLVDELRWISETRFLHALNYCMMLPGPEAQQLATYIGWLQHRTLGGLIAGGLFILPGFLLMLCISTAYCLYGDLTAVQGLLFGLKAAVLAVVVEAVMRVGKRALKNRLMWGIAAAAFVGIFFLEIPFPLIILGAAVIGLAGQRFRPELFAGSRNGGKDDEAESDPIPAHAHPSLSRSIKVLMICGLLWWAPILAIGGLLGWSHIYAQQGLFFSKMAVVTFGGAYAVLAYVAQEAVNRFAWLAPGEMIQGLALAETTPGPLILVLTFVGYVGAFRHPGVLNPVWAGVLGATLTTWVTFVPCFLWIFLGAPYIEKLRTNRTLSAALSAITAAVVGVILNLAVWFALHALFADVATVHRYGFAVPVPRMASIDMAAAVLAAASMLAMLRFKAQMIPTLFVSAVLGLGWKLAVV